MCVLMCVLMCNDNVCVCVCVCGIINVYYNDNDIINDND